MQNNKVKQIKWKLVEVENIDFGNGLSFLYYEKQWVSYSYGESYIIAPFSERCFRKNPKKTVCSYRIKSGVVEMWHHQNVMKAKSFFEENNINKSITCSYCDSDNEYSSENVVEIRCINCDYRIYYKERLWGKNANINS